MSPALVPALATDGYGMAVRLFILPDPALQPGWRIVGRHRTEDGEHVWTIATDVGEIFRWLEDEGGPEWAFRTRAMANHAAGRPPSDCVIGLTGAVEGASPQA